MRSRPQEYIKVVITTQIEKSTLPVKRHLSSTPARLYKYERPAPHLFIHSLVDQSASLELQLEKKRERGAFLGEHFLYLFELSLGIVLAIYIKEVFFSVFSPMRVSQDKWCVSYDCVFLSDPILCYFYLVKWKEL